MVVHYPANVGVHGLTPTSESPSLSRILLIVKGIYDIRTVFRLEFCSCFFETFGMQGNPNSHGIRLICPDNCVVNTRFLHAAAY